MKDKQEIVAAIESSWRSRARTQGLKPGTVTYRKAECEFFCGAMQALHAVDPDAAPDKLSNLVPPIWVVNIMCGRPVVGVST